MFERKRTHFVLLYHMNQNHLLTTNSNFTNFTNFTFYKFYKFYNSITNFTYSVPFANYTFLVEGVARSGHSISTSRTHCVFAGPLYYLQWRIQDLLNGEGKGFWGKRVPWKNPVSGETCPRPPLCIHQ